MGNWKVDATRKSAASAQGAARGSRVLDNLYGQTMWMKSSMSGAHPFANPEPRDPGEAKRLKIRHASLVLPHTSSLTLSSADPQKQ